jgi:squalene cyclase
MVASIPDLRERIAKAEEFLLSAQTEEGLWSDFALEPGGSEAWTTAEVAVALAEPPVGPKSIAAIRRAADLLHSMNKGNGWGYNRSTATDADTTAWVLRFLANIDDLRGIDATALLQAFVDADGSAHTFRGFDFGSWNGAHADVTPAVGLALAAVEAPKPTLQKLRAASLAAFGAEPPWQAFWWTTATYAVAQNLEFLAACGGIPREVCRVVQPWLARARSRSAFEAAQLLMCAVCVAPKVVYLSAVQLLQRQNVNGSWAPSPVLLVPSQHDSRMHEVFADIQGIFTTGMALIAVKRAICVIGSLSESE